MQVSLMKGNIACVTQELKKKAPRTQKRAWRFNMSGHFFLCLIKIEIKINNLQREEKIMLYSGLG